LVLVHHGYKHDFESSASNGGNNVVSPSFDGSRDVTIGSGRKWTSLSSVLHDSFIMIGASFEEGFGVWGGKNSEIGDYVMYAGI
jgi:hypothetical protein